MQATVIGQEEMGRGDGGGGGGAKVPGSLYLIQLFIRTVKRKHWLGVNQGWVILS